MIATSRPLTITPDAERFLRERKAQDALGLLADLTSRVFPDALRMSADLHEDPDVADARWVLIRVVVPWTDGERARQARDQWYAHTGDVCSPGVLANFGLEIDRRPG